MRILTISPLFSLVFASSLVYFHQQINSSIDLVRKQSSSSLLLSSHMHRGVVYLQYLLSLTFPWLFNLLLSSIYLFAVSNVSKTILVRVIDGFHMPDFLSSLSAAQWYLTQLTPLHGTLICCNNLLPSRSFSEVQMVAEEHAKSGLRNGLLLV